MFGQFLLKSDLYWKSYVNAKLRIDNCANLYTINFTIVELQKWDWVSTGQVSRAQLNGVSFLSTMFANKMVRRYLANCHWHIDSKSFPVSPYWEQSVLNSEAKIDSSALLSSSGYGVPIACLFNQYKMFRTDLCSYIINHMANNISA